ncbi:MAG: DNA polymerase/3'-5' exonuclease PolX [Methanomicrobiales archaeon]|nr:DNA polymerase/3'-5' exonuclease PolX [Methanomicrobiales archaeon]
MEASNAAVADALTLMGQLLEITGQDGFKVRAYYRAAEEISRIPRDVAGLTMEELMAIPGIGKGLAEKIQALAATGTHPELEALKAQVPGTLIELLELEGVGPKTVHTLWMKAGITSVDELERAARGRRIRAIRGFGEKKEQEFLRSIAQYRTRATRLNRAEAEAVVARVAAALSPGTYEVAGSYRRGRSTVGDVDIVSREPPHQVNSRLRGVADEVIEEGDRRTSIRVGPHRVDLRFTPARAYGSMLLYLTGSKEFNIRLREMTIAKGLRLNEYGIEDRDGGGLREFADEETLFSFLGMDWIPPELREDRGEIPRALAHDLPGLATLDAIRGDLHVHSIASDGTLPLPDLARAGEARGYRYLLVSDHSASLGVAHGLDPDRIAGQAREIEQVNRSSSCRLLHGIEVDILADGTLPLPPVVLADLDLVIASVHSAFHQEKDVMTRRVLSAMASDHVDIIGHPTGRLLGSREPFALDLDRVIEAAADTRTALEINASPLRMDLDDAPIRQAKEAGVKLAIGTDAHSAPELDHMKNGVVLARRGWCTPEDLLNALDAETLLEWTR